MAAAGAATTSSSNNDVADESSNDDAAQQRKRRLLLLLGGGIGMLLVIAAIPLVVISSKEERKTNDNNVESLSPIIDNNDEQFSFNATNSISANVQWQLSPVSGTMNDDIIQVLETQATLFYQNLILEDASLTSSISRDDNNNNYNNILKVQVVSQELKLVSSSTQQDLPQGRRYLQTATNTVISSLLVNLKVTVFLAIILELMSDSDDPNNPEPVDEASSQEAAAQSFLQYQLLVPSNTNNTNNNDGSSEVVVVVVVPVVAELQRAETTYFASLEQVTTMTAVAVIFPTITPSSSPTTTTNTTMIDTPPPSAVTPAPTFTPFTEEDPFEQDEFDINDIYTWPTTGDNYNGLLVLEVWNAMDDDYDDLLELVIADWNKALAVSLTIQKVTRDYSCNHVVGVIKVCNHDYGQTNWRGINEVILDGRSSNIVSSVVRINEYYFLSNTINDEQEENNADYFQLRYTLCHNIGHAFGLPHTDENFYNPDLGDCLDYTNTPENNILPGQYNLDLLDQLYGV